MALFQFPVKGDHDTKRVLNVSGGVALLFALLSSKPLLEALLSRDGHIEYPNDLYIYGTQLTFALGAATLLIAARFWSAIASRFVVLTAHGRALRVFALLVIFELLLVCCFLLTANSPERGFLHHFFHLGHEWNLPTYFSAAQLLLASALTLSCARASASSWSRWVLLCSYAILVYLATDEVLQLHESWGSAGVRLFQLLMPDATYTYTKHGAAWTFVAMCVAIPVGGLLFYGYWRVLENQRLLLAPLTLAGLLYLFAAVGLEDIGATKNLAGGSIDYFLVLEEWLEMLGVSIAVYVFVRLRVGMAATRPLCEYRLRVAPVERMAAASVRGE